MVVDRGWPGEPYLFLLWMVYDVLQRLAEHAEPVGLAYDHRVQRYTAYERLFCRLTQQLFELTADEVTKLRRRMMSHQDLRAMVDLDRVRYAHDWTSAGLHPERLIVGRPVHQEIEPDLLQQVGRPVRRGHPWWHPAPCSRSGVRCVAAIHGAIQPLGGFPDARSIASRTSCRNRFSSDSHMWLWRSAFVRPCPMNSSPRAFSASTIRGA